MAEAVCTRLAHTALLVAPVAATAAVVNLVVAGRVEPLHAFVLASLPALLAIVVLRPALAVLIPLAIPPGALELVGASSPLLLAVVVSAAVAARVATDGRRALPTGAAPVALALLVVVALLHGAAPLEPLAHAAARGFLVALVSYVVLLAAAYAFWRAGIVGARAVAGAVLVSCAGTAVVFLAQTGFDLTVFTSGEALPDPGWLGHRTQFGYFMALGFGLALARQLGAPTRGGRFVTAFFAVMVAASFTRGAWVASLALVALLPLIGGRRSYWMLAPVPIVVLQVVDVARERAFGDIAGGVGTAVASGELGSNRVRLWQTLWERVDLPWGGGFGHMWTLDPESLFGVAGVFVTAENPFVYPHNDFVFWTLELGVVGLGLFLLFWASIARAAARVVRHARAHGDDTTTALVVVAAFVPMLVAELVDNGLAMRGLAQAFFVAAGIALAQAARGREQRPR